MEVYLECEIIVAYAYGMISQKGLSVSKLPKVFLEWQSLVLGQ